MNLPDLIVPQKDLDLIVNKDAYIKFKYAKQEMIVASREFIDRASKTEFMKGHKLGYNRGFFVGIITGAIMVGCGALIYLTFEEDEE